MPLLLLESRPLPTPSPSPVLVALRTGCASGSIREGIKLKMVPELSIVAVTLERCQQQHNASERRKSFTRTPRASVEATKNC